MKTFATTEQEFSNTDIRGQNDPKLKAFLENLNSAVLLFQDYQKFDQRNPRALELSRYISGKVGSFLKSEQFREKVDRKKGKTLSGSKKSGNDGKNDDEDDDEFDDNDDRVYGDSEGKVIPSFKTRADGRVNNLLEGTYGINKLQGTDSKEESQYSSDDEDRKKVNSTLNRRFENIESMVNRENRFGGDNKEGIDPEDEALDEGGWLVFLGGYSERKKDTWMHSKNKLRKKGFTPSKITN